MSLRTDAMRVGSGLSTDPSSRVAARAACAEALSSFERPVVDLAVVFISAHHVSDAEGVLEVIHETLSPGSLIGCSAQGVIAGAREIEESPAVSVWAARLPDARVETFEMTFERTAEGGAFAGFPDGIPDGAAVLMLADPFTFPVDALLERLNQDRPGVPVVGGLASGGGLPGAHRLLVDTTVSNGGAIGAVVAGVRVRTLVSQGCRPIGSPGIVTKADRNVIVELAGRPPLERLRDTFAESDAEDRALMQRGVHIGIVIDEYKTDFARGDFLIRNVLGADAEAGVVAVGDLVEVGNTVQFHVRDARSADEDLRSLLATVDRPPAGALLFSCNGRGSHLFGLPDHDAQAIQRAFRGVPLAGFFCAGELGPVGGRNFLHGFTASMALFERPDGG